VKSLRIARASGAAFGAVFAAQFALLGAFFRASASGAPAHARPFVNELESAAVWAFAAALATTRARRAALAALAATLLVVQANVFRYYHAPLDVQVAASALHAWADVRGVLSRALPGVVLAGTLVFGMEYALLVGAHRALRPERPGLALSALAACAGLFGGPPRSATPDVQALSALSALRDRREPRRARARVSLPPLHAERAAVPSVLFVLTESVRAEDYGPATAPETLAILPERRDDLTELRAVASYTAVSFSALITGRSQEAPREDVRRAPTLFDFARAARDARGRRPAVAYVASQSADVFEAEELRAPIDRFVSLESFAKTPEEANALVDHGLDDLVAERALAELRDLGAPSVFVLHLGDTHAPYVVDPARAPFRPYGHTPAWSAMRELHNAYLDAIVRQDRLVARVVRAFIAKSDGAGAPWLVVLTSDHGEAFGEHGAIHHGQNLFDEQVHVPGFVLAGPGALSPAQERALRDDAGRFVTHLDVLPTVLDALGLWDNFAVAPYRAAMKGRSLLRAPAPGTGIVPVTNCTGMFPCPVDTWGLFEDDHKLLARIYDGGFACFAVDRAGHERLADGPECDRLRRESRRVFPLLPNGAPNR
jgi:hypothetical protein